MALTKTFNLLISRDLTRYNSMNIIQFYSVFPPTYIKPIYRKEEQEKLHETGEDNIYAHSLIRPATSFQTSSEFGDPLIRKFINYIMRKGNKSLSRTLLEKTFANIKMIQLESYNKALPDQKQYIELDPKIIFYSAVRNCTPILELKQITKGGIPYQVPVPIDTARARHLAMNWLIKVAKEKDRLLRFPDALAKELISAANNQGRVIKKKHDLHKQCEANRTYAHFRWL